MTPLLAPITVDDLLHADALGDGKLTDANLLAIAMDRMPAEVEAMQFVEGRPYMDEMSAQLADGGDVQKVDGGAIMLTLKHPRSLPDDLPATPLALTIMLRPMTVGDVYAARGNVTDSEVGQDLSLMATLSGEPEAALRRMHIGDWMKLQEALSSFFARPRLSPPD